MANKCITYPSGAVLTRKIKGNSEVWELDNKSLNDSVFTIDLSNCQGIEFEGTKDKNKEAKIKYLTKKDMFTINKTPPFTFAPTFNLNETPISLEEQRYIFYQ